MTLRPLILALLAPTVAVAGPPAGLADRAWSITEAVLSRSIDPPARQQMLLSGLKAMRKAGGASSSPALAREVSAITTPDQFAASLARAWPTGNPLATADQIGSALLEGLITTVPGPAELISAKDLRVAEQIEGNLYVGVQIALGGNGEIAKVLEGGPADKAGAKEGDRFEVIDGVAMAGRPIKDYVDRLRGPRGTAVSVRLRRKDLAEPLDREMIRDVLPRVTVEGHGKRAGGGWDVRLVGPGPIGYLKFKEIVGSTPAELAAFATQLESDGILALVLDFRQVEQANLHAATLLADAFLDGGTIGRVRTADSVETVRAQPDSLFPGWPLAALVGDRMPAEARWLCSALEDNHRATILGTPGGAGREVETAVPLPGGDWSVRMATGLLERADGRPCPESIPVAGRRKDEIPSADRNYLIQPLDLGSPRAIPIRGDLVHEASEILRAKLKESGS